MGRISWWMGDNVAFRLGERRRVLRGGWVDGR